MRGLGLVALSSFFAATPVLKGQAPVLTVPRNLTARDTNEVFDAVANTWSAKAPMPTARTGYLGVAAINGRIYIAGGDNVGNLCQPADILEAYDPATDSWATLQPMLHPRWDMGSTALGGLFYVVGGQTSATACGAAEKTVEAYDPANGPLGTWSAKPSMNFARRHLAVVSLNGMLYAIGGIDSANACVDTVEAFDPTASGGLGAWTTKESLITKRGLAVAAVANGKIYVMGGTDCATSGALLSIEEYDPGTGHWTSKNATVPSSRSTFYALAVLNNKIYLIGGGVAVPADLELFTARVDVYDPVADAFSPNPPPPMLTARSDLAAATVNNKIYAIGGLDFPARFGQRFVYQITARNHPTSYSVSPALPSGLTLDQSTGIISGVPSEVKNQFLTFTAANASGSDSRLIYFQVGPGPLPPGLQIVSGTCATGRTAHAFQFHVLAQNASSSARFTAGGFPYQGGSGSELSIDSQSGLITGMVPSPADSKPLTYGISVGVVDGGQTATGQLQLTFVSEPTPITPVITSSDSAVLIPGQLFSYTMTADAAGSFGYIGTDGIAHKGPGTSTAGLPSGLQFDGVNKISGTYTGGSSASREGTVTTGSRPIKLDSPVERPGGNEQAVVTAASSAVSPIGGIGTIQPKTLTIRPPGNIAVVANDSGDTGVGDLNFVSCPDYTTTADASPVAGGTLGYIYNSDCSLTVTATPNSNYSFENWTENGQEQSTSGSYTFAPTANRALVANFAGGTGPLGIASVVSRKIDGAGKKLDVDLTKGNGIECRMPDAGNGYRMVFSFSTLIANCGAADTGTASIGPNSNQCSVQLSSVPNAQYTTVHLSGVTDTNGSNGSFSGTVGVLIGDVDGSGRVDSTDVFQVRQQTLQNANSFNYRFDVNGSGRIDSTDIFIVRSHTLDAIH